MKMLFLALPIPLFALAVIGLRDLPRTWEQWKGHLKPVLLLFGLGAYVANPFLAGTGMGTGEAFNYSLAIADGVTQFRAGEIPVLVGQTEYAFNGRIHPLRTAPYYVYAACVLDSLTLRTLSFWELQSLLLTLSLIGSAFSCYAALHYLVGASRRFSLWGTALWMLSPAVLAVTYSMDLFMTVTTLPFAPLAIGANLRSFQEKSVRVYLLMGVALALTWLCHPPIALWVSASTVVLQAAAWLSQRPSLRTFGSLGAGVAAAAGLVAFGFASTLTMQGGGGLLNHQDISPMFVELQRVFPAALLPVSQRADQLSDFQLGYVGWAVLLLLALAAVLLRRLPLIVVTILCAFYLVLTLPVGGLTPWLWTHIPGVFANLTNIWPMQRLYLVTLLLLVLAAGYLGTYAEAWTAKSKLRGRVLLVLLALAVGWNAWQAQPYLDRGNMFLKGRIASEDLHRSENLDTTIISYAMLGVPSYFTYGVVDATRWFRILAEDGRTEKANNWTVPDPGPVRATGTFRPVRGGSSEEVPLGPAIKIRPGKRYLLDFQFHNPAIRTLLVIAGERFYRQYSLPSSNTASGFGTQPGNDHRLPLWTTYPSGEELRLRLAGANVGKQLAGAFADFKLFEVEEARLPVRVERLFPMTGSVDMTQAGWVETPRRFIPGYQAWVDGAAAETQRSPEGAVMFKVPPGSHRFELRYPGPAALRAAFWLSASTAVLLLLSGAGLSLRYAVARLKTLRRT